ncbi:TetR/AcrR family transcriptional regulator [Shewanella eurypsychrophilus]|uniref:TetR/AcrR family transcriptional regulator n=1 Tax=Shewanella eurypsychrophilus TaxID=2593656 RepID=A0ABX6V0D8_9GAMM|nr:MULTISPECIES: TetR/AcrR family transcriptional regulator [Shewanella]QFU20510.1 TetR family transcriptional regulator [Shewanella sp. YLB-09]QFU20791.1 TetR family transcriptional regulator [Shewanella sp. YLB-09]QPG56085.1 TetR/AcrR family transcriptional regulator [Shewanella eurypsychrophilus]
MKTRDKIIHASLELFNQHGERTITTNHIAAHLGISPGNLYYHFRNKEDIIRSIFSLYESHLEASFHPYEGEPVNIDLLIGYFDAIFYAMWEFRFMYANLTDILTRDEELKAHYLNTQQQVLNRCNQILMKLNQDGVIEIEQDEIPPLAETIRMIVCFWISYKQTHSPDIKITKCSLYEGLLRILMLSKAYSTATSRATFERLELHYKELATSPNELTA